MFVIVKQYIQCKFIA